jgi:hypothetical protein
MRLRGSRALLSTLLLVACAGDLRGPGGAPEGVGDGGPLPVRDGAVLMDGAVRFDAGMDAGPVADAAASIDSGVDAAVAATRSHGGTITFQELGAVGWYPSRRDPASGECDAIQTDTCCMSRHELTTEETSPWNEELIMTLRGPMQVYRLAVYQPFWPSSGDWKRMALFEARTALGEGLSFDGDATAGAPFGGTIGNQCLVDVASDEVFPCGSGSVPYCPEAPVDQPKHHGWRDAKLFVMLLAMPHASDGVIPAAQHCGNDTADNWYDAPWIGFSHGELVRSGKFGDCHCYAKDPAEWFLGDGCGQFNAFEVVNDNNDAMNLDVFSTNFFGYQGYIGEGPCGDRCDTSMLAPEVDLIDKSTSLEAAAGAIATPSGGPGAAFVRPSREPRYFIVLFGGGRTVQLAIISPARIPAAAAAVLPALPDRLSLAEVFALESLRLPN